MLSFPYQNDFETDCQSLGYDDHTIESYRSNLRLFFEHVQAPPEEITNTHLNEFLRYLRYEKQIIKGKHIKIGASKSTIKTYFSSLHIHFFSIAHYFHLAFKIAFTKPIATSLTLDSIFSEPSCLSNILFSMVFWI